MHNPQENDRRRKHKACPDQPQPQTRVRAGGGRPGQQVAQLESETEPLREELAKQIGEVEERVGPLEGGAEQVKIAAGKLGISWS